MAIVSLLQFNNYLDELPVPSLVATAGGRNLDKALAHAYENTRDFLRKGFGMQVRGSHFLTRHPNLCACDLMSICRTVLYHGKSFAFSIEPAILACHSSPFVVGPFSLVVKALSRMVQPTEHFFCCSLKNGSPFLSLLDYSEYF
jgi:hypothetical protein